MKSSYYSTRITIILHYNTWKSIKRLPENKREFLWAGHPNAAAYAEIAKDILPVMLAGRPSKEKQESNRGLLARFTFEAETFSRVNAQQAAETKIEGDCTTTMNNCSSGKGCYRWYPNGSTCYIQQVLKLSATRLQLFAKLRVAQFPGHESGCEVLTLMESNYGTGVTLELSMMGKLRLHSRGANRKQQLCGPIETVLRRELWYGIRIDAQKSDNARVSLNLLDSSDKPIDSIDCTNQPTGGGTFSHLRIGSANPLHTSEDVFIDDVSAKIKTDTD